MTPHLAAQIDAIQRDRLSGSTEIARQAAQVLASIAEHGPAEFGETLVEACRALVAAQPQMAPVFRLANEALLHGADPAALLAVSRSFAERLTDSADRIAALSAS